MISSNPENFEDTTWESQFISLNSPTLTKFLRIFHPKAKFGFLTIFLFFQLILFFLFQIQTNNFISTFLYISLSFLVIVFLYNLPELIFNLLFPPIDNDILEHVSKSVLCSQIKLFRRFINVFTNIKEIIHGKCDILTLSGVLSVVFGILLFIKSFPFYVFFHIISMIILFGMEIMARILCNSKPDLKK